MSAIIKTLKRRGIKDTLEIVRDRFIPVKRIENFSFIEHHLRDKIGFEIGGFSRVFSRTGPCPVYPIAAVIDNCNYSSETIWEGQISKGNSFVFEKNREPGFQHVGEAANVDLLVNKEYDFVLSSHVIEHCANPLKVLQSWRQILKPSGILIMVVPDKNETFDRRRDVTKLEHLIQDHINDVEEDDLTHLRDVLDNHDMSLDAVGRECTDFENRCKENLKNRCIHHHVFDETLVKDMLEYAKFNHVKIELAPPHHIFAICVA